MFYFFLGWNFMTKKKIVITCAECWGASLVMSRQSSIEYNQSSERLVSSSPHPSTTSSSGPYCCTTTTPSPPPSPSSVCHHIVDDDDSVAALGHRYCHPIQNVTNLDDEPISCIHNINLHSKSPTISTPPSSVVCTAGGVSNASAFDSKGAFRKIAIKVIEKIRNSLLIGNKREVRAHYIILFLFIIKYGYLEDPWNLSEYQF